MRETRILEFKETITNTFLKTVSAFSNYDGGEILFGVDDDGNIKGLSDVKQACLDIENKINDSISPQPNYTLEIQNNEQTIKFNLVGYYKISFIISARVLKTDTVFDPKEDFISIGLRLENTDNIYIGNSEWIYNEGYIQLKAHGILAVDNPDNTYELINVGPKTIYLNTPDINYIKSSSYFTNSLVSIMVEYLGK